MQGAATILLGSQGTHSGQGEKHRPEGQGVSLRQRMKQNTENTPQNYGLPPGPSSLPLAGPPPSQG